MRLAHRLFVILAVGHVALVVALTFLPSLSALAGLAGATLYLPLVLFDSLGLPVFSHTEPGGWSLYSAFSPVLAIAFWSVVWLAVGYAAEIILRPRRHA